MDVTKQLQNIDRKRWWSVILYPEHFKVTDLHRFLLETHIPCCLSPLHDPDPECKKPHYHLVLYYAGKVSQSSVTHTFDNISGGKCPLAQPVDSPRGMIRYLLHLDNPDKQQFSDQNSIIDFNGFNSLTYLKAEGVNEVALTVQTVRNSGCSSITQLVDFLLSNNQVDMLNFVVKHSYFFQCLLNDMKGSDEDI